MTPGCAECGKSGGWALYCVACMEKVPRREWVGLTEQDFSAINQSSLTKLQAATCAESILKEKNGQ